MPFIATRGNASSGGYGFGKASSGGGSGTLVTGTVYTVSSTYSTCNAPTYQYMNNSNADGSINNNQWGSNSGSNQFIKADVGSTKSITKIVIGYDYLSNLPGGWGPSYTQGLSVDISTDNSTWTTITTTPNYASTGSTNGLVNVTINSSARYIRLFNSSGYVCTLEFEVWAA